jgi:L-seryl-tRNA(Ser) seleniumtransferase
MAPDAKLRNMSARNQSLRDLPQVNSLAASLKDILDNDLERVDHARNAIEMARALILQGDAGDADELARTMAKATMLRQPTSMINATGVILHTNLGRAPLSAKAAEAASTVASGYSNAELDRVDGSRGMRGRRTRDLLTLLTGAEDALVVNNNAAGVMLTLSTLAAGKPVPVSRGELIEIGGSYRLPDVMRASGARLVEVGTTNRTRPGDYETALQIHDCGLVLKVHNANYEVTGFVADVSIREIAEISDVPVVYDVGSGLLDSTTPWLDHRPGWLGDEPGVRQSLQSGADLVLFSGDKLLGGPQAGIVAGKSDLVDRIRRSPIARAMRVGSPIDAALGATLEAYAGGTVSDIPFWRMATATPESLRDRTERVRSSVGGVIETGASLVGAGSAPGAKIEGPVLRLPGRQDAFTPLLQLDNPVLARRDRGDLILDLRTVNPEEDAGLVESLSKCL